MSYCDLSLTFDFDSDKMLSIVIFEVHLSYDNDIQIAATQLIFASAKKVLFSRLFIFFSACFYLCVSSIM